jgi:hypothetical protein
MLDYMGFNDLTLPRNHASVMNAASDRLLVTFDGAFRLLPSLRHRTFDNVMLNPFASRAGERSQVLARIARFDRGQPHWRTASCALRTLVLYVEHSRCSSKLWPLGRRPEFTSEPADCVRFERIRYNDGCLNVIAPRAFKQAMFETNWSRRNTLQHHSRLAARAARALNNRQELLG